MDVRIGRFLSQTGLCSRRDASGFIQEHQVCFLGKRITTLNFKIESRLLLNPLVVDNKKYFWQSQREVIMLHKPEGYISSHRPYKNKLSVMSLMPPNKSNFFFAGRLDKDSTGLMIFSNDGEFIYKLTHPSFKVKKVYLIYVRPPLDENSIRKCLSGFHDKKEKLILDKIELTSKVGHYKVELHRGKNREIRRIMKKLNRFVLELKRIQLGSFKLKNLKKGSFKILEGRTIKPSQ